MTPAQFNAYAKGHMDEQKDRQELTKAYLYILSGMIRAAVWEKKMPEYKKFFPKEKREKTMTDEEMYQMVLALNKAMGGTVDAGR